MSSTEPPTGQVVLVVDDEVLVQDLITGALEEGGFAVATADSDDEAIDALEADHGKHFVAIVTDVNLRRPRTGWDIARRARELYPTIPVVYVTGDSEHDWTVNGVPRSIMIAKPFAPVQLVVAVASLVNKSADDAS